MSIPLNLRSASVWRTKDLFSGSNLFFVIVLSLTTFFYTVHNSVLVKELINRQAIATLFCLFILFLAANFVSVYLLRVFLRTVFIRELRRRIEEKRKEDFSNILKLIRESGNLKDKEAALKLARTPKEKGNIAEALFSYLLDRIMKGDISEGLVGRATDYADMNGFPIKKVEEALMVGSRIRYVDIFCRLTATGNDVSITELIEMFLIYVRYGIGGESDPDIEAVSENLGMIIFQSLAPFRRDNRKRLLLISCMERGFSDAMKRASEMNEEFIS